MHNRLATRQDRALLAACSSTRRRDRPVAVLWCMPQGVPSRRGHDSLAWIHRTQARVAERVAAIARDRKVTGLLRAEVGSDPASGKPTLSWAVDQAALAAEAATEAGMGC
jgi:hypothetical protein